MKAAATSAERATQSDVEQTSAPVLGPPVEAPAVAIPECLDARCTCRRTHGVPALGLGTVVEAKWITTSDGVWGCEVTFSVDLPGHPRPRRARFFGAPGYPPHQRLLEVLLPGHQLGERTVRPEELVGKRCRMCVLVERSRTVVRELWPLIDVSTSTAAGGFE